DDRRASAPAGAAALEPAHARCASALRAGRLHVALQAGPLDGALGSRGLSPRARLNLVAAPRKLPRLRHSCPPLSSSSTTVVRSPAIASAPFRTPKAKSFSTRR